jgi:hypothetical protein
MSSGFSSIQGMKLRNHRISVHSPPNAKLAGTWTSAERHHGPPSKRKWRHTQNTSGASTSHGYQVASPDRNASSRGRLSVFIR